MKIAYSHASEIRRTRYVEYLDEGPDEHGRRRFFLHWLDMSSIEPERTRVTIKGRSYFRRGQIFHARPEAIIKPTDVIGIPDWAKQKGKES